MGVIAEFKEFITKGNVLDLAVAVVIGGALNMLVTAFVTDLVTPLIGVAGHVSVENMTVVVNGSKFMPGAFANQFISFVIMAAVVFFLLVRPVRKMQERKAAKEKGTPTTKNCPYCLSEIPAKATRCPNCTSRLPKS